MVGMDAFFRGMRENEPSVRVAAESLASSLGKPDKAPEVLALVGALAMTNEYPKERGKTYGDWAQKVVQLLEERGYRIVVMEEGGSGVSKGWPELGKGTERAGGFDLVRSDNGSFIAHFDSSVPRDSGRVNDGPHPEREHLLIEGIAAGLLSSALFFLGAWFLA